ncbi:hypothetical protein C0Q70_21210 [Pomacea canaliculata]|uniref:Mediator of RNA polymerase II transcription subunit 4 n=2 Tax=Pomacea canaliculata TaxID=400727 RepID=A0A2T7NBW0_POMCA|nr:hypothetical protein C0Q70_21210 [Pomacea canaliculata]
MSTPKSQQKPDAPDTISLMELLIERDNELKSVLQLAEEQAQIQKVMDALKFEVDKRDTEIRSLQRSLKEAETILATGIYQAKQKLKAIDQANQRTASSEEIIKFAHRISASSAVAAPNTWGPGDPRRPYPTDLEMRQGFLGMGTFPDHQKHTHIPQTATEQHLPTTPQISASSLSWQPSQEVAMTLTSGGASHHSVHDLKGHNKENEDVELMSSDSSSSSSSDE